MKNIIQFLGLSLLIPFFACNEDSFSPIVEIDIPEHKSRLVVRADWVAGSDSLAVFISKSKGVLDKNKANFSETFSYWNGKDSTKVVQEYYDTIPNTKVELLKNGQLLGTIPYSKKGYHVAKGLFKLDTISGTSYTIRVSAPNFETAEASQKVQGSFKILRGGYRRDAAVSRDESDPFSTPRKGDELTFELEDNGSDENYYTLSSPLNYSYYNTRGLSVTITKDTLKKQYNSVGYLNNIDPNMEDGFLPDRTFNGKNYLWRFWLEPNLIFYVNDPNTGGRYLEGKIKKGDKISTSILSVSKDYILFLKTLDLAYSAQDNPFFTEPVILHTNVKNGYGIFTISSKKSATFVVP
jgi:Domain of unknown function (DUF4249)